MEEIELGYVKKIVENNINNMIKEVNNKYNIKYGDMYPEDFIELELYIDNIAKIIKRNCEGNMGI